MGGHHHRSGTLKQKNKQHKAGRHATKTQLDKKSGGKIERRNKLGLKSSRLDSKQDRMNRAKHLRQQKKEELWLKRRTGTLYGAPKIVALVPLCDTADIRAVHDSILKDATNVSRSETSEHLGQFSNCFFPQQKQRVTIFECDESLFSALDVLKVADTVVYVLPMQHGPENALNNFGETAIAAIRAQGAPSIVGIVQGLEDLKPKMCQEYRKHGHRFFTTEFGADVKVADASNNVQLLRAITTVQGKDIHWRNIRSYMMVEKAAFVPSTEKESTESGVKTATLAVRGYIRGMPLSVNQLVHVSNVGTFQMSHINAGLDVSNPIHNRKRGDMPLEEEEEELARANAELQEDLKFEADEDPFAAEQTWPTEEELLDAERRTMEGTEHETSSTANSTTNGNKLPKGMSSYQASWMPCDMEGNVVAEDGDEVETNSSSIDNAMRDVGIQDEDEEESGVDQSFCKVEKSKKDDREGSDLNGNEMSTMEEQEDDGMEMEMEDDDMDEGSRQAAYEDYLKRKKDEHEDNQFPDEVDCPTSQLGKTRFARYRGLKSFRTSYWDPKESLPTEYSRIFQFKDFNQTQRVVLAREKEMEQNMRNQLLSNRKMSLAASSSSRSRSNSVMSVDSVMSTSSVVPENTGLGAVEGGVEGYVASGTYVTLYIRNVPSDLLLKRDPRAPLVLCSLLKHENRLSVVNFNIQRHTSYGETVKSKDVLTFQCGFRRFEARPIFSEPNLNTDKNKFMRFLPQGGWSIASLYSALNFQPATVLVFDKNNDLVATGTLQNVDPDRIVLKRIVLTGVPVRVKRRKAVVRYMFHTPEDIRWFKPIELTTKHGLTGHITQSLGTHGDFKAIFNKPIKQHDTVCLNLYKRVFPKRIENKETQPSQTPAVAATHSDSMMQ